MIFQENHLNDVEIHPFFHFQVHTTVIYLLFQTFKIMGLEKINLNIEMEFTNLHFHLKS
jgi:hypothetical protein